MRPAPFVPVLLVVLTGLPAVARAAPRAACPGPDAVAAALGAVAAGWHSGCAPLGRGRQLLVAARAEASRLDLRLAVTSGGAPAQIARVSLSGDRHPEIQPALFSAESWRVGAAPMRLGSRAAARVSVWARWGEGLSTDQEIAALVELGAGVGAPRLLWIGTGDRIEERFGACRLERRARFALRDATTLERRLVTRRTLGRAPAGDALAADMRRACSAAPPRRELLPIEAPPAR
jgi:hypothetical protein